MAYNSKAKLKTLYVRRILEDETDAEHGLSMRELIDRLAAYEITAERKSVYRDIQILREFGVDIKTYQRNPVEYAIERRDFTLSELMLLVDAVESCKSLTRRQSNALVSNLKTFASDHQRAQLDRRIHVPGRISSKNESVFGHIDVLHEALRLHKKISFMYYKHDLDGTRVPTHNGEPHVVTPVGITYSDGFYYLTAWNDNHEAMIEFRIDRMEHLQVVDEKATRNDEITHHTYDGDEYEVFGRFNGDPVTATLLVDGDNLEIILDRFGSNVQIMKVDDQTAKAVVKVRKSHQFYGWIAGMANAVRIEGPASLKQEYRQYLQDLLDQA